MNTETCDCRQGRDACSCKPPHFPMWTVAPGTMKLGDVPLSQLLDIVQGDPSPERLRANVEEQVARINTAPKAFSAGEYWVEVAMRRGKQLDAAWAEIRSLNVRVQVLTGLAVIGWAAVILQAMGA